ncbi:hypothetical protein CHRY9390_00808 [Chryseobacterium aquaeductus]|uniref:Uncharacterized protein n=1 Tax=Chryseobacterium aquaeductus TaxID=2675056 RepID=A0A9N8ME55_9FLAO|nr:hypothetical protein CHRY9390_00808 [Chryseobacterium potabilaquae]CAD7801654.1 hypothetical protein CHRY9390_00808 [Chryseobacterium aquaeductus]
MTGYENLIFKTFFPNPKGRKKCFSKNSLTINVFLTSGIKYIFILAKN